MELLFALIVVPIGLAVFYLFRGGMDEAWIKDFLAEKGYGLLSKTLDLYQSSSPWERNDRIYAIRYEDSSANVHKAHVHVSFLGKVYWTGGGDVRSEPETASVSHADAEVSKLLNENRELKAELDRLQREGVEGNG